MRRTGIAAALALVFSLGSIAVAEPQPPVASPLIEIVEVGLFCRPRIERTEDAPETTQGYINLVDSAPTVRFAQQKVPAALNVSFGVTYVPGYSGDNLRMETWVPGRDGPDIWYTGFSAGTLKYRGFTFEFPEELILGLWRLEAWDGETLLYSIEFEVVPPSAFPEIVEHCNPIA